MLKRPPVIRSRALKEQESEGLGPVWGPGGSTSGVPGEENGDGIFKASEHNENPGDPKDGDQGGYKTRKQKMKKSFFKEIEKKVESASASPILSDPQVGEFVKKEIAEILKDSDMKVLVERLSHKYNLDKKKAQQGVLTALRSALPG